MVGSSSGAISPVTLAVNHLAVRFVDLSHGLDTDTGPCFSASLALKVALPAGVATTPYYSANVKGSVAAALHGLGHHRVAERHSVEHLRRESACIRLTARTRPMTSSRRPSTVASSPSRARSRSTRPSRRRQARRLRVSRSPALSFRRRQRIRRPSSRCTRPSSSAWPLKTRLLRFVVFSSGDGTLKATLGSTWLGSAGLHAGNNDIRYVLPTRLLKSLRKTNTPANVLTLTSYSMGGTQGASVIRRVAMKPVTEAQKAPRLASRVARWRPTGSSSQPQRSPAQASGWRSRTSSTPQG